MRAILPILMLSAAPVLVHGQAIIEYGATAGATAGAAATAGKSVKGVFGQLNKTLAGAARTDEAAKLAPATAPAIPASGAPAATAQAAPAVPADFSEIVAGMDKADLLKKAGKPSMSVT